MSSRHWGRGFFRKAVFSPGEPQALARAPEEAAFAFRVLGLKRGSRLLDLCCGAGRHSLLLAGRGLEVTGLDATPAYLSQARWRSRVHSGPRFLLGDMRRLSFREEFDAVINLWTSFGYFTAGQDQGVLRGVARALKPGGLFLIDVLNGSWLRRHFMPRKWERRPDGSYLLEDARLEDGADPLVVNRWTVLSRGRPKASAVFRVRLYDKARLVRALRQAGLIPLRFWGGFDGGPLAAESARLIVLSRKRG